MTPNIPSGAGLGGFRYGLSADDITVINSTYGGSVSFRKVDEIIASTGNYNGFYNRAGSMVRDIAGGHLFDNGNKRAAVEVVGQLVIKNGVDGPPKQLVWKVVDKVSTGQLKDVEDIAKALRRFGPMSIDFSDKYASRFGFLDMNSVQFDDFIQVLEMVVRKTKGFFMFKVDGERGINIYTFVLNASLGGWFDYKKGYGQHERWNGIFFSELEKAGVYL